MKLAGRRYASSGISENAGFDRFDSSIFKDAEQLKRTQKPPRYAANTRRALNTTGRAGCCLWVKQGLAKRS